MRYTYEAVITKDSDGWVGEIPQLSDSITQGETREDVIDMLSDMLLLEFSERIDEQGEVPAFEHVVECVSISVDLTEEDIEETRYITTLEAQRQLGLSEEAVSALAKSGQLESRHFLSLIHI